MQWDPHPDQSSQPETSQRCTPGYRCPFRLWRQVLWSVPKRGDTRSSPWLFVRAFLFNVLWGITEISPCWNRADQGKIPIPTKQNQHDFHSLDKIVNCQSSSSFNFFHNLILPVIKSVRCSNNTFLFLYPMKFVFILLYSSERESVNWFMQQHHCHPSDAEFPCCFIPFLRHISDIQKEHISSGNRSSPDSFYQLHPVIIFFIFLLLISSFHRFFIIADGNLHPWQ